MPPVTFKAREPVKAMVYGSDRSMFPGPFVMTSICPNPTIMRNEENPIEAEKVKNGLSEIMLMSM